MFRIACAASARHSVSCPVVYVEPRRDYCAEWQQRSFALARAHEVGKHRSLLKPSAKPARQHHDGKLQLHPCEEIGFGL